MITVDELLAKEAWIQAGADEGERALRLAAVEEELFPPGLDEAERAAREGVLEAARAEAARRVTAAATSALAAEAEPSRPPPATSAPPPPPSPLREPIRWRSSVEEHGEERAAVRAELDAMLAQAKTPFDLAPPEDEPRGRRRRGLRP